MTVHPEFYCIQKLDSLRGYGAPASWDDAMELEQVTCPIAEGHMRGGARIGHLRIVLPSPRVGDFVATWHNEWLIQDHVLECFREAGFTGFDVAPVEVTKVRRQRRVARGKPIAVQPPPRLWELVVTGWGGEVPDESGIRMTYYCEGCGYTRYSDWTNPEHVIDRAQWDGSDFFTVWPLPRFIFVTDRVAELIVERKYTGLRLVRPKELDCIYASLDSFSPGAPPTGRNVKAPEAFEGVEVTRMPRTGDC
jgi:hypothetical protein